MQYSDFDNALAEHAEVSSEVGAPLADGKSHVFVMRNHHFAVCKRQREGSGGGGFSVVQDVVYKGFWLLKIEFLRKSRTSAYRFGSFPSRDCLQGRWKLRRIEFLMPVSRFCLILWAGLLLPSPVAQPHAAERETIKTYAITGGTGAELYASIGERGPVLGHGQRVIAHTSFTLTWKRDYREEAGACRLAGAVPSLVITYTLPKPSTALSPAMAASWKRFSDGVRRHEAEHGRFIREMVAEIEAASVGLSAAPDPGCRKVRQTLNARLKAISDHNTARNAAYDRVEMSEGGAVHQLILALVNGP